MPIFWFSHHLSSNFFPANHSLSFVTFTSCKKSLSFAGHLAISMRQIQFHHISSEVPAAKSPKAVQHHHPIPSPPAALKNHARGRNSHAALDSRATPHRSSVHWFLGLRKSGHHSPYTTGHIPKENRWRFLKVGYYMVLPPKNGYEMGKMMIIHWNWWYLIFKTTMGAPLPSSPMWRPPPADWSQFASVEPDGAKLVYSWPG